MKDLSLAALENLYQRLLRSSPYDREAWRDARRRLIAALGDSDVTWDEVAIMLSVRIEILEMKTKEANRCRISCKTQQIQAHVKGFQ